ncbi:right-handed parallel beta-helix repeat-containing protein [Enemella evansiae]|uniref:right-handed parallel beta-helix repeat-containing protein n=1 Tax=Enemella evansiae TaxID=2016499 RepID=UPI001E3221CA|nr:right-handed parallel beta-helix repeat-containing protein [Enemella evansiae]
MTELHVSPNGSDAADGSESTPFRTINHAAQIARAGDTVVVHAGEYREWVKPRRGGLSDQRRITYTAADGDHVAILGSERVDSWERQDGDVWKAVLPNSMFGDWNPFALELRGDWVVRPVGDEPVRHLGDVYLDGKAFYEADSFDQLASPQRRDRIVDDRTGQEVAIADPDQTTRLWFAEVDAENTTVWATFHGADPNREMVEVSVRRSVFQPEANHIDYITVRGFELAHAATPWAPPTGDQPGLIGPNWAKGWIIEQNHIHHAKCSAVSLGKEASTGDNWFTERRDKPGYQYQLEAVFRARQIGWSREQIGSHIVRDNVIHDCGQNGIVGHLGCVFSEIRNNEIHDIATKREFYGHEIGGIKLHAAIDVQIVGNHIHDCALGIWSDWQTQGTRISRNVLHDNNRDLYVEVSHGPYIVDHNVLASPAAIEVWSDGGAYVGNLVAGTFMVRPVPERPTPYHVPHSTEVAGYAGNFAGDDRIVGNVFVGNGGDPRDVRGVYEWGIEPQTRVGYGTLAYDGHPASFEEFLDNVEAALPGDVNIFDGLKNPVYLRDNIYLNGAQSFEREESALTDPMDPGVRVHATDGCVELELTLPEGFADHVVATATTQNLGRVRMVDAEFDAPDGAPLSLDEDLLGGRSGESAPAGPIHSLEPGPNRVTLLTRTRT